MSNFQQIWYWRIISANTLIQHYLVIFCKALIDIPPLSLAGCQRILFTEREVGSDNWNSKLYRSGVTLLCLQGSPAGLFWQQFSYNNWYNPVLSAAFIKEGRKGHKPVLSEHIVNWKQLRRLRLIYCRFFLSSLIIFCSDMKGFHLTLI